MMASAKDRISKIITLLSRAHPDATCQLNYSMPFELVVGVILSAQCTDAKVNEITPMLFRKYRNPKGFATARTEELERDIRPTGFFKNKARSIQNCCRMLIEKHGGIVPEGMDDLLALPGLGRKSANAVRVHAFGRPGIVVDTHMLRVTERLGLAAGKNADKVEEQLNALVPRRQWARFSNIVNMHGRRICVARKPKCDVCTINHLCPSRELML